MFNVCVMRAEDSGFRVIFMRDAPSRTSRQCRQSDSGIRDERLLRTAVKVYDAPTSVVILYKRDISPRNASHRLRGKVIWSGNHTSHGARGNRVSHLYIPFFATLRGKGPNISHLISHLISRQ